ncbi:hypothetical protein ABZT04_14345 [Streptomyces sp. NPDC005492]|uniref:hypothetical protein n=1 Tax=Streptomyces sp. NPDC005492 TaxID=3156883 RepID=UPI0033A922B4
MPHPSARRSSGHLEGRSPASACACQPAQPVVVAHEHSVRRRVAQGLPRLDDMVWA